MPDHIKKETYAWRFVHIQDEDLVTVYGPYYRKFEFSISQLPVDACMAFSLMADALAGGFRDPDQADKYREKATTQLVSMAKEFQFKKAAYAHLPDPKAERAAHLRAQLGKAYELGATVATSAGLSPIVDSGKLHELYAQTKHSLDQAELQRDALRVERDEALTKLHRCVEHAEEQTRLLAAEHQRATKLQQAYVRDDSADRAAWQSNPHTIELMAVIERDYMPRVGGRADAGAEPVAGEVVDAEVPAGFKAWPMAPAFVPGEEVPIFTVNHYIGALPTPVNLPTIEAAGLDEFLVEVVSSDGKRRVDITHRPTGAMASYGAMPSASGNAVVAWCGMEERLADRADNLGPTDWRL